MKTSRAIYRDLKNDLEQSYQLLKTVPIWVRILVPALYVLSIPIEKYWEFAFDTTYLRLAIASVILIFAFQKYWPQQVVRNGPLLWFIHVTLSLPFTYGAIVILNAALTPDGSEFNILPITEYSLCLFFMIQLQRTITLTLISWLLGTAFALSLLVFVENPNVDLLLKSCLYSLPFVVTVFTLGGITQNALAQYQQEKEDAIWRIATSIAHQLRTPLATIQNISMGVTNNFVTLTHAYSAAESSGLKIEKIAPRNFQKIEGAFTSIVSESENAKTLIDILIANSKPFQAQIENTEIFEARSLIETATDSFPYNSYVERQLITLNGESFIISANRHLFLHVLYNLIGNAVEFAQKKTDSSITITSEIAARWNTISVRDTGIGIPKKYLSRVFDPFFSRNSMNGTGIGLPFCKAVIEDMGGRIYVSSEENVYTEFVIKLPKVRSSSKLELEAKADN